METIKTKTAVRPKTAATSSTARASARFDAARRAAVRTAATQVEPGKVIGSLRDSAPGVALISWAIAEAVFVEPIRTLRRKLRRSARII